MASKIKVDQIEGSTGSSITIPSGQTLTIADGLASSTITSGTLADARIPDLNASKITAGTIASARLGSGTANSSTFLRGDGTFATAGGGVAQVVQSNLLTKMSTGNTSYTDTGLQCQITPTSASHKVLVFMDASGSSGSSSSGHLRIIRDSTQLRIPDSPGSRTQNMSGGIDNASTPSDGIAGITSIFLDSPNSTSQLTYKVQIRQGSGGETVYFNRSVSDANDVNQGIAGSSLILMEITV